MISPEMNEPSIPLEHLRVRRFRQFGPIELRADEGFQFLWVRHRPLPVKAAEFPAPSVRDQPAQLGVLMIGEIEKRSLRPPFLALEQQGHERRQHGQRRDGLELRHSQQHAQALALRTIADLIVILRAYHELMRGNAPRRSPMPPRAMRRILPLIHVALAQRGRHVLEAPEIRVVAVALAGEESVYGVMKIVGPVRVQSVAAPRRRAHQPRIVEIALGDEHEAAAEFDAQLPDGSRQLFEHMDRIETENSVDRIEA